jgi:hypothetical protein
LVSSPRGKRERYVKRRSTMNRKDRDDLDREFQAADNRFVAIENKVVGMRKAILNIQNKLLDDWADYGSTVPVDLVVAITKGAILAAPKKGEEL